MIVKNVKKEVEKPEPKTVQEWNMLVFKKGAFLAILGTLIPTCVALNRIVFNIHCRYRNCSFLVRFIRDEAWKNAGGGAPNLYFDVFMLYVLFILGVAIIQLVIYIILKLLTNRNIEISGTKEWLFYAFELVVALTPFVIMWTATIW